MYVLPLTSALFWPANVGFVLDPFKIATMLQINLFRVEVSQLFLPFIYPQKVLQD
jgi:hypothetical protein